MELVFEVLIRPANYKRLMKSEKAFRPSTARHINSMFVAGETLALLLYIPDIICIDQQYESVCIKNGTFDRLTLAKASATAILGPTIFDSVMGRLVLGSVALRFFGVVRHWQHMLIQQTFCPIPREGLEKWIIPFDPARRLEKRRRRRLKHKKQNDEDADDDTVESSDGVSICWRKFQLIVKFHISHMHAFHVSFVSNRMMKPWALMSMTQI